MDELMQGLAGLLMAVLTAAVGFGVQWLRTSSLNLVQARLGSGAARLAGEMIAEIAAQPSVQAVTNAMMEAAELKMRERFPDTTGALPGSVLRGMIVGELGKLGQAVRR